MSELLIPTQVLLIPLLFHPQGASVAPLALCGNNSLRLSTSASTLVIWALFLGHTTAAKAVKYSKMIH